MPPTKKRSYDIIIGSFVSIGLIALVLVVFLIGKERRLFDSTVSLEAHFPNVAGLAVGADVMLSGVVVGHVSAIKFPVIKADTPGLLRDVTVVMQISKRTMPWIREDSIARIDSKGLLGDKLINISIGSQELPQMQPSGMLQSTPPLDFNKALQQAQEILQNVTETVADAKDIFKNFVAQGGDAALADSAKSLRKLFKEIETGEGVIHNLIYDKSAGKDTALSIKEIKKTFENVAKVSDDIAKIASDIRNKDSLIHALIYDPEGSRTVASLNTSLKSLGILLSEVKDGSGIIHDLIYTKDNGQFLRSLNKAALDLENITADIKSGKGSLGLFLRDPSLYNEIYGLLGNLRRNRLLKAVIRHNISKDEAGQ